MFVANSIVQLEVRLEKALHAFLGGTQLHETISVDHPATWCDPDPRGSTEPSDDKTHHQRPGGPHTRILEGWEHR